MANLARGSIDACHAHPRGAPMIDSEEMSCGTRRLEPAPAHERSAIVDAHHHRFAGLEIRHPRMRAERQRARGRGHRLLIVNFASAGRMPMESRSIPRSHRDLRTSYFMRSGWLLGQRLF